MKLWPYTHSNRELDQTQFVLHNTTNEIVSAISHWRQSLSIIYFDFVEVSIDAIPIKIRLKAFTTMR